VGAWQAGPCREPEDPFGPSSVPQIQKGEKKRRESGLLTEEGCGSQILGNEGVRPMPAGGNKNEKWKENNNEPEHSVASKDRNRKQKPRSFMVHEKNLGPKVRKKRAPMKGWGKHRKGKAVSKEGEGCTLHAIRRCCWTGAVEGRFKAHLKNFRTQKEEINHERVRR